MVVAKESAADQTRASSAMSESLRSYQTNAVRNGMSMDRIPDGLLVMNLQPRGLASNSDFAAQNAGSLY